MFHKKKKKKGSISPNETYSSVVIYFIFLSELRSLIGGYCYIIYNLRLGIKVVLAGLTMNTTI
jgi:hypothetical protein